MKDQDRANEDWLQGAREDFDMFLSQINWSKYRSDENNRNCLAVIDSIRENGHEHSADILKKAYLKKQYDMKMPINGRTTGCTVDGVCGGCDICGEYDKYTTSEHYASVEAY